MREFYQPPDRSVWQGRVDDLDNRDSFRWHQVVEFLDLTAPNKEIPGKGTGFCFLGFICDEGVVRNKGRGGASAGPRGIRAEMANLPVYFGQSVRLFDAGDICCLNNRLTPAQDALAVAVEKIRNMGLFPLLLGGGHEIALGHFKGLTGNRNDVDSGRAMEESKPDIGIINFDAHFDLRPFTPGEGNSGTAFTQIADYCEKTGIDFSYFCVGIQQYGNTRSLFQKARQLNSRYLMARDIRPDTLAVSTEALTRFMEEHEQIYLTICADVISSAYAPGVSAPQPFGLHPETVLTLVKHILAANKTVGLDVAEISPRFDEDNRSSRLAAIIFFAVVNGLA